MAQFYQQETKYVVIESSKNIVVCYLRVNKK